MAQYVTERTIRQEVRRFLGVVGFFVLAMAATWGVRAWRVAHVVATVQEQQEAVVADALVRIDREFAGMQQALLAQAKALAETPRVVRALREWMLGDREQGEEALIRYFADPSFRLPDQWAVELYDVDIGLVAWKGFSMPLDEAPESPRFLESFQTEVAEDDDWRQALAMWYPVHDGVRTLGAVRILRMLHAHTPVKNQYLQEYNIGRVWRRRIRLPVDAQFQRPFDDRAPATGRARLLQGADGTILGRVVVEPPPADQFIETVRTRYDDVLAFWATLLLAWVIAGLWSWYLASERSASTEGRRLLGAGARLALVGGAWWAMRYALIALDVPARWQRGKAPLAPLFDPSHLASAFGGGLMRSTGDFLITAFFLVLFAFAFLSYAAHFREQMDVGALRSEEAPTDKVSPLRAFAILAFSILLVFGLTLVLSVVARHAILDSTMDFFTREGLIPRSLLLAIYCALLLCTLAVVVFIVGLTWMAVRPVVRQWPRAWPPWSLGAGVVLGASVLYIVLYGVFALKDLVSWPIAVVFLFAGVGLAVLGLVRQRSALVLLTLRNVLPAIFLVSFLLYPMVYSGLDTQRRILMEDAAESFNEGRDPGLLFDIKQVLDEALAEPTVVPALVDTMQVERRRDYLDSLATVLLRRSLLASRSAYDVSLLFLDADGQPAGRYDASDQSLNQSTLDQIDVEQFGILRLMYTERDAAGPMVEQLTGRLESDRFQYVGVVPVGEGPVGWIMARAEPKSLLQVGDTPFFRVLLPESVGRYANLSLAEFRDGVLIRSRGSNFGRYRLSEAVRRELVTQREVWQVERVKERSFLTFYHREPYEPSDPLILAPEAQMVDAVRLPVITAFDHLYYLLRLTLAGLVVGLLFYGLGLYLRWRAGLLPAPRVRFRDRVLNAFLSVGILVIAAVGVIGVSLVKGENERAIRSRLRQHLERVEKTLALEAQGDEMPYRVLERIRIDSLAAQVGLDLNQYEGAYLIDYSRPQLIQERLIDLRLPIQAFEALLLDGFQFTYLEEQLGTFRYTAGFRTLLDEQGQPVYVLAVPTLPEQERIEEEQARTVAYLFGALLLLVVVVMTTASLLANALARPVARLRVGLEAVAQGRFERKLPVGTRDEIGELVQTFNVMQEQLAESRRKLAQQERQLAWREMARQVAHEIKNPLTPMKLSVQHLRRAYADIESASNGETEGHLRSGRFAHMFERVTGALVEQIDTLARIANEFSTFARMPTRIPERLDLNDVVRQAVSLMQAEAGTAIGLDLYPEPLVVEVDHEELRRIYINLLKNALQALAGDGTGRVTVSTQLEPGADGRPGMAYSAVIDTGVGIPPELRDKIFHPNFSTKTSGAGLGLAIARKTLEELNGEIDFETREGAGTTFWIRLPLVE